MGFFSKITNSLFNKQNVSNAAGAAATVATGDPFTGYAAKEGASSAFDWLGLGSSLVPAIGAGLSFAQQNSLLQKQMNFQEYMSGTAHQREVKDLLAAGINPLYTATGGNGASTPMGATGTQTDFANAFSSGIGKAFQKKMMEGQLQNMAYQNMKAEQEAWNTHFQGEMMTKQLEKFEERFKNEMDLMKSQAAASIAAGAASSSQSSYYNEMALFQGLDRKEREELWAFLNANPEIKKAYMTSYGIGRSVNGLLGK